MGFLLQKRHHFAKNVKVVSFRNEFEGVFLEKRNYYRLKFFPPEYLISITVLMVRTIVFLEVNTSTSEEIFERKENVFVALDEFNVEFWFYDHSSGDLFLRVRISNVDSEASFPVYKSNNILWTKILL